MDPRHFELATQFVRIAGSADLLEYLGVPKDAPAAAAQERLREKRKYLQAMQANPKLKDQALFLIKHFGAFEALLQEPGAYVAELKKSQEADKIPMLEMAIDSVLADGVLTASEEEFVRRSALDLGISLERYEQIITERAAARGIELPKRTATPPPPPPSLSGTFRTVSARAVGEASTATASTVQANPQQQRGSQGWWDQAFTRLVLAAIPAGPGLVVDVACGPAWSALTLLPERHELRWVGVERDAERLANSKRSIANTPFADRTDVKKGFPDDLPFDDESVDFVLSVMALHDHPKPVDVFAEARRILRPGGRVIAVEPDSLGHRFYFDTNLEDLNRALQHLRERAAAAVAPADVALGPKLGRLLREAGLEPIHVAAHVIHGSQIEPVGKFAMRVRGLVQAISAAARLAPDSVEVREVEQRVRAIEGMDPHRTGLGAHILPTFVVAAVKM